MNLLLESSYSHIIQINSKNNEGQTALDICNANSQDDVSKEIGSILERAAARQQSARDPEQISDPTSGSWNFTRFPIETRNGILTVLGMIATAFFTAACDFPNGFVKGNHPQGKLNLPMEKKFILKECLWQNSLLESLHLFFFSFCFFGSFTCPHFIIFTL